MGDATTISHATEAAWQKKRALESATVSRFCVLKNSDSFSAFGNLTHGLERCVPTLAEHKAGLAWLICQLPYLQTFGSRDALYSPQTSSVLSSYRPIVDPTPPASFRALRQIPNSYCPATGL